jgi:anti-sigma regulatory factor (Ser/Thr protein kinase)
MTTDTGFRHVALFYDDADTVVAQIADTIERDHHDGAAVLVCLPDVLAAAVSARIRIEERVTFLPAHDRYARPVRAMEALWWFTTAALADGATRVQSIGQIGFDGSPMDDEWHWYERAVNDVFADAPLTATCLFDTSSVSPDTIACAHATHAEHLGQADTTDQCDIERLLPRPVALPQRRADLTLEAVTRPGAARHALALLDDDLAPGILDRAKLIVSELVTNAILHGGGRADVRYWHDPDTIFVEVADDGPGIDDPVAILRPPALGVRGVGLWVSNIEATRLHVAARHPHGTIATAQITGT